MSAYTLLSLCLTIYLVQSLNYRAREFIIPVPPTDKGAAVLVFTALCLEKEGTDYIVNCSYTLKGFLPADSPTLVCRTRYTKNREFSVLQPVRLLFSRQVALLVTLMEEKRPYWTTTRYTFLGPEIATSKYHLCYQGVSGTARAYMLAHLSDSFLTVTIKPGSKEITTATIVVNNETRSGGGETVSVDLSPNHYGSATASWMNGTICGSTIEGSKAFVLYTDQKLSVDKQSKEGSRLIQPELPEQLRYGRHFVFVTEDGLKQDAVLTVNCPSKLTIQVQFESRRQSFLCSPPMNTKRIIIDSNIFFKYRRKNYLIRVFVAGQEEQVEIAASLLVTWRAKNVNTLAHGVPLNRWSNRYAWMRPTHDDTYRTSMINAVNVFILNSRPETNNFTFNGEPIKINNVHETVVNDVPIGLTKFSVEAAHFVIASESQILVYVTMYHKGDVWIYAADYAIPVDEEQELNCSSTFCPKANCVFDYTVNGTACSLCEVGRYTLNCTVCEQGTYGKDCAHSCLDFCSEPFCEPDSGKCITITQIPWYEKIGLYRIAVALVVLFLVLPACYVYFIYRYYARPSMLRAKIRAAIEKDPYWQDAEEYGYEYFYEEVGSSCVDEPGHVYSGNNSPEVDFSNANATELSTEMSSEKLNTGDIYPEIFSEYGHHERNFENNRQSFYHEYGFESTNAMTWKEVNGKYIYRSSRDRREVPYEYRIRSLRFQTESHNKGQRFNSVDKGEMHAERMIRNAGAVEEMHDKRKTRKAVGRGAMHDERKTRKAVGRGEMHDERKTREAASTKGEMHDQRNVRISGVKGERYEERKMREAVANREMHDERKIKNTRAKGEFFDEHNSKSKVGLLSKRSLVKSKGRKRRSKCQSGSRHHRKFPKETENRNAGARRDVFFESQRGSLENDMSAFEPQALMVGPEEDSDEEVCRDFEGGFSLAHKMRKMKKEGQTADLYGPIHAYKETSV